MYTNKKYLHRSMFFHVIQMLLVISYAAPLLGALPDTLEPAGMFIKFSPDMYFMKKEVLGLHFVGQEELNEVLECQDGQLSGAADVGWGLGASEARRSFFKKSLNQKDRRCETFSLNYQAGVLVEGDKSRSLGARYYITISVEARSEESRRFLREVFSFSVLWGLVKSEKTEIHESQSALHEFDIAVHVYQEGGNPGELAELELSFNPIQCKTGKSSMEVCHAALVDFLSYGREAFAKQIRMPSLEDQDAIRDFLGTMTEISSEYKH